MLLPGSFFVVLLLDEGGGPISNQGNNSERERERKNQSPAALASSYDTHIFGIFFFLHSLTIARNAHTHTQHTEIPYLLDA